MAAIFRVMLEQALLELGRGGGCRQQILGEIEIVDDLVVKRLAARHAMSRQDDTVGKIAVLPQRRTPAVEITLADEQMSRL
jgi:hypothetical protein